jgi:hypothetical protein
MKICSLGIEFKLQRQSFLFRYTPSSESLARVANRVGAVIMACTILFEGNVLDSSLLLQEAMRRRMRLRKLRKA